MFIHFGVCLAIVINISERGMNIGWDSNARYNNRALDFITYFLRKIQDFESKLRRNTGI